MSLKKYGIYLAFPPTVDLRAEGLGRHLAMFLKGAEGLGDSRFLIVCPSWSRETLQSLFESEQVASHIFEIESPKNKPYVLDILQAWRFYKNRPKVFAKKLGNFAGLLKDSVIKTWQWLTEYAVSVNSFASLAVFGMILLMVGIALVPISVAALPIVLLALVQKMRRKMFRHIPFLGGKWKIFISKIVSILLQPEKEPWIFRLFDEMQKVEAVRMQQIIDRRCDVRAWYTPTAFWPSFNNIKAPRLMCVPDIVLNDFPVGFSMVGGNRTVTVYEVIERAIKTAGNYVTYSNTTKWGTLVDRYGIPEDAVKVIPHAPNDLHRWVKIDGLPNSDVASRKYCHTLMRGALKRSTNREYTRNFKNEEFEFLFYASQFRPSKNVLTLLRAYTHLLRKRYLGVKLLLTGHPDALPEIRQYIDEHRLENDVIFLHGLKIEELAAIYKLAMLAVNPSLSEGGCPFTFTEALSVGTPVVMARIPVTEEVIQDPDVQDATFFDPYDWEDCASRIEWAIKNRAELLSLQLKTYAELCERSWTDVVREHLQVLDEISAMNAVVPSNA